ncbi:MAG: cytochrome c oxidase subunit 3 [Acidobacteria bacterium]|nr:cytochrome c oxidase subunit 3 [Acidobacteriota bacterium]MCW5967710.1 cytochrome c oxidase subunit 3 [Blastocatellales bacterium]
MASSGTKLGPDDDRTIAAGGGGFDELPPEFGDGGDRPGPEQTPPPEGYRLGIWLLLISITAAFLALTSAYIYLNAQVRPLEFPTLFAASTVLILATSITVEYARLMLRRRRETALRGWLWATMGLGAAFLCTQAGAFQQLALSGFYVNTNHRGSFAYIFTGVHAAHLLGGLLALGYVLFKTKRERWTAVRRRAALDVTAVYWHFLDGVWLYSLALLFLW